MALTNSDFKWYLTGASSDGGAQTDPDASFGNYRAASEMGTGDENLYDDVSGAEASAGDTEYRCYCIKNTHASLALTNAKVYMQTTTGNASDVPSFAVEVPTGGDTNGTCQSIGGEGTSPTVNTGNCSNWSTATTYAGGVAVNIGAHDTELSAGEIIFVWTKRAVSAGAAAANAETVTFRLEGDSAA